MFAAAEFQDEKAYYEGELGRKVGTANSSRKTRGWRAGLAVYDISRGEAPREIGFMPIEGGGIHRLWYTGGRWAYASALIDGFTDYIFITIDSFTIAPHILAEGKAAKNGVFVQSARRAQVRSTIDGRVVQH